MGAYRKYENQMPWVGTRTQRKHLNAYARAHRTSVAGAIRAAVDAMFDLEDGEERGKEPGAQESEEVSGGAAVRTDER